MSSKYTNLAEFLIKREVNKLTLSFAEVEGVLGFPLPPSAKKYRAWWANDSSHSHARNGWLSAGWRVVKVSREDEVVQFQRVAKLRLRKPGSSRRLSEPQILTAVEAARRFEEKARKALNKHFNEILRPGQLPNIRKLFDFVSADRTIVGDAKYYSLGHEKRIPPAKFSAIAEGVWLLEKIQAKKKFLIFGNDRRVPERWLQRFGNLIKDITFYFLEGSTIQQLN
jgi:hypothetical protein